MPVYLHGLSTALPPHVVPQSLVRERAERVFGLSYPQFARISPSFENAGIDTRRFVVPIDWFEAPHSWAERNAIYAEAAQALLIDAAETALKGAGWSADSVDCIVTVSSTGVATPTLEARVMHRLGFRHDVRRVPVFGLGCAGGVSGLSLAQSLAATGARVLLVTVETCSLAFRSDRLQKADIVAAVLFGDGAAAACLSNEAPTHGARVTLDEGTQVTWPDTLDIMGWDMDEEGFGVVFDRSIPAFVTEHFAQAADEALARMGLARDQVARFVCHPGGAKVVVAIEEALGLAPESLDSERDVLRRAGNMSAPTVLFVLETVLRSGAHGQMVASALGPGFTAAFLPIHVEAAA